MVQSQAYHLVKDNLTKEGQAAGSDEVETEDGEVRVQTAQGANVLGQDDLRRVEDPQAVDVHALHNLFSLV